MTTSDDSAKHQGSSTNPPRDEQHSQAAQSPAKEPANETATIRPAEAKKASSMRDGPVQPNPAVTNQEVLAGHSPFTPERRPAASLAQVRPRDLGVSNDVSMDSTVDTDGKDSEARRDLPILRDHVISSNASLDDSVATPDLGLGGIESRPGGNMPLIAAAPGYRVEYLGSVSEISPWLVVETAEMAGKAGRASGAGEEEPVPFNGTRSAHVIRFVRTA